MAKNKPASTPSNAEPPNLEEQIRTRAFELYEERDREDGHDVEDWLRAEGEITHSSAKAKAA